jgi:hypothetical protein
MLTTPFLIANADSGTTRPMRHDAHLRLRVKSLNSVTFGGRDGGGSDTAFEGQIPQMCQLARPHRTSETRVRAAIFSNVSTCVAAALRPVTIDTGYRLV